MAYQATTGLGTATNIIVQGNVTPESNTPGYNNVILSVSGVTWPETFQLNPSITDVAGTEQAVGTSLTLTSVAAASPGPYTLTSVAASSGSSPTTAVYTGTITSGGSNAYAGRQFVVAGFTTASSNGTFQCTASTTTTLTLTNAVAVADSSGGTAQDQTATAAYSGTITGGGSNALAGQVYVVSGFVTHTVNNGTFVCTGSSTSVLTLANPAALSETHSATAVDQESTSLTYIAYTASAGISSGTTQKSCATVNADGVITAAYAGHAVVEVSYPAFNNSIGDIVSSGNIMAGSPINKIYAEVNVTVVP
jgi:hypothetical protein